MQLPPMASPNARQPARGAEWDLQRHMTRCRYAFAERPAVEDHIGRLVGLSNWGGTWERTHHVLSAAVREELSR
jgi:hypothetical protein